MKTHPQFPLNFSITGQSSTTNPQLPTLTHFRSKMRAGIAIQVIIGMIFAVSPAAAADPGQEVSGNDTVTVNMGETLSGGDPVIEWNGPTTGQGVVIINNGTIDGDNKRAIETDKKKASGDIKIINNGTIKSSDDDAMKFRDAVKSGSITIENAGKITSKDNQALDMADLASPNVKISITNKAGGTISAADSDGIRGGNGTEIINSGTISAAYDDGKADSQNNAAIKINGERVTGGYSAKITNNNGGIISGSYHGIKASGDEDSLTVENKTGGIIRGLNGSGVNSNGTGTVTNYGEIIGTYDNAASFGDGDGVDFDHAGIIYNYGSIKGLGSKGTKSGETSPSTSEAIAIGGGTIINGTAMNKTAIISGADNGILADDSNKGDAFEKLSVTNYGTIEGKNGFGIKMVNGAGNYSNTIINYGIITGTSFAAAMGNGDDRFVYQDGSSVTGNVDAEGGTDTFMLGSKSGSFDTSLLGTGATYINFEKLEFDNAASWTLTGTSSFSGITTIASSNTITLNNASLGSSAFTLGGILTGVGTIGNLTVNNGGTIAPGSENTPGSIHVNGTAAFNAGSTYLVYATPTPRVSAMTTTGAVALDAAASVKLMAKNGTYTPNQTFDIITSDTSVNGKFASKVINDAAFLAPVLSYDLKKVSITLKYDDGSKFESYAQTDNQKNTAKALQSLGQKNALFNAIAGLKKDDVPNAYNTVSGNANTATNNALNQQSGNLRNVIMQRMGAIGGTQSQTNNTQALGYDKTQSEGVDDQRFDFARNKKPSNKANRLANNMWVQAYGGWGHDSTDTTMSAIKTRMGGIAGGVENMITDTIGLGFLGGYSQSAYTIDSSGSSGTMNNYDIGAYATTSSNGWTTRGGASFSLHDVNTKRNIVFPGYSETAIGSYWASTFQMFGEASYKIERGSTTIEPFASAAYVYNGSASYTETGSTAALSVNTKSSNTFYTTLGARFSAETQIGGQTFTPNLTLGWQHAFGDTKPSSTMRFASNPASSFSVTGAPRDVDVFLINTGFDYAVSNNATLSLNYNGAFSNNTASNALTGQLRVKF